jgi:hypothetical protein
MLTKDVVAVKRALPTSEVCTISSRCCGRKPSVPAAETAGNDLIIFITSDSVAWYAKGMTAGGTGRELVERTGCLSRSFDSVCAEKSAGVSSEHRILTAAVMLPSSSLAVTAAVLRESTSAFRQDCGGGCGTSPADGVPLCRYYYYFSSLFISTNYGCVQNVFKAVKV